MHRPRASTKGVILFIKNPTSILGQPHGNLISKDDMSAARKQLSQSAALVGGPVLLPGNGCHEPQHDSGLVFLLRSGYFCRRSKGKQDFR